MQALLDVIGSAAFQVGAVLLIAQVVYRFSRRDSSGLLVWLGLRSAPSKAMLSSLGLLLIFQFASALAAMAIADHHEFLANSGVRSLASRLEPAPLLLLVLAVEDLLQTSLSEELLFRGLLGKRFSARFGLRVGNLLQAALFGAIHLLSPFQHVEDPTPALVAFCFLLPFSFGYSFGWVNERLGEGSILPGWLAHGAGNLSWSVYLAFFWS